MLPQAIAGAHIHMGTIAGKLNGVIPATTPRGWRIEYTSIPVEACSEKWPRSKVGMPQACSITSSPRCTSPDRVGEHLAVLGGEDPRDLLAPRVHELADAEHDVRALGQRDRAPALERRLGGVATALPTSSTEAKSTSPVCAPIAGS